MTDTLLSGTAHAIGAFTTMQCPFGQWWRDVVVRRAHAAVRWTAPSGVRPVAVGMVVACWTGWTRCRGRCCATATGGEGHAGTAARVPGSGRGARGHRRSAEHDLSPGRLGVFGGAGGPAVPVGARGGAIRHGTGGGDRPGGPDRERGRPGEAAVPRRRLAARTTPASPPGRSWPTNSPLWSVAPCYPTMPANLTKSPFRGLRATSLTRVVTRCPSSLAPGPPTGRRVQGEHNDHRHAD